MALEGDGYPGNGVDVMILPEHFGYYVRVGLAIFWTSIAVWETFQNGFRQLHVLLWWAAVVIIVLTAVVEGVRSRRARGD